MFSRSHFKRDPEAAFTLAELMVSIAIIGIIMAIAVPLYNGARQGAKVNSLKVDITSSALNVNTYYTRYGIYPDAATFNSKVAIISRPTEETLTFNNPNAVNTQANQAFSADVCVSGTSTISNKVYTFSYNLAQKKLVTGNCTYIGTQAQEPVQ